MSQENGRFEKGNPIGKDTRFKKGHSLSNKYKREYAQRMLDFFNDPANEFPTFELFAKEIGVTSATLENWADNYPHFLTAYDMCKTIQRGILIKGALVGKYNAQFAKFLCVASHGMTEKTVADNTVTLTVKLSDEVDEESN